MLNRWGNNANLFNSWCKVLDNHEVLSDNVGTQKYITDGGHTFDRRCCVSWSWASDEERGTHWWQRLRKDRVGEWRWRVRGSEKVPGRADLKIWWSWSLLATPLLYDESEKIQQKECLKWQIKTGGIITLQNKLLNNYVPVIKGIGILVNSSVNSSLLGTL